MPEVSMTVPSCPCRRDVGFAPLLLSLALGCADGPTTDPARLEIREVGLDVAVEAGRALTEHWASTNLPFPDTWCVALRGLDDPSGRSGVALQRIEREFVDLPDNTTTIVSRTEGWTSTGTGPDWTTPLDVPSLFLPDPVTGAAVDELYPGVYTACDRRTQTSVALADGGFAVLFTVRENVQGGIAQLQIARFDADGALRWHRLLPFAVEVLTLSALAELSTGDLAAAWVRRTPEGVDDAQLVVWTADGDEVFQGDLVFPDDLDGGTGSHMLWPFSIVAHPGGDFTVVGYTDFVRTVYAPVFCTAQGLGERDRCEARRYFAAAARFRPDGAQRWVTHSGGRGGDVVDADDQWYQPGFQPSARAARWGEDGVVIVGRMEALFEHQVDPPYGIGALWVDGEGRIRSGVRACPCSSLLLGPPDAFEPLDAAEDGTVSMVVTLGQPLDQRIVELTPDGDVPTVRPFRTLEGRADLEQVRAVGDGWLGRAFDKRSFLTLE